MTVSAADPGPMTAAAFVIAGRAVNSEIVAGPLANRVGSKTIVSADEASASACVIASRNVPGPMSASVVTTNVATRRMPSGPAGTAAVAPNTWFGRTARVYVPSFAPGAEPFGIVTW